MARVVCPIRDCLVPGAADHTRLTREWYKEHTFCRSDDLYKKSRIRKSVAGIPPRWWGIMKQRVVFFRFCRLSLSAICLVLWAGFCLGAEHPPDSAAAALKSIACQAGARARL